MKELVLTRKEKKIDLNFGFLKKDLVFTISLILATLSCFIHAPKLHYIDFKVLVSLFNLMLAVKAFEELKLLDKFAVAILNKCTNSKRISAILIFLCFFTSMFVTNDVALITFVPLTLIISKKTHLNMIETIILQTIAANIGSSLTPMGNPQNLFIFSYYGIKPLQFLSTVLFVAVVGMCVLYFLISKLRSKTLKVNLPVIVIVDQKKSFVWGIVFCIIIASILGVISYQVAFLITMVTVCFLDRKLLLKVDYLLLLTFICFFIFIGNLSNIALVQSFASEHLKDSTAVYFNSILLSQFISNVPASILLAKFTTDWHPLLIGVNLGGLGTIIASLASVISYKLFIQKYPSESKTYLIKFSIYNFSFLSFLTIVQYFFLKVLHIF
ncbi:SLC13 family permease [Neobacillus sp. PS3-40]|uniref:SLC13 family permease n=1 Tax=Neobacillus sp. PS3-40 TaxID=3070679 RepID=UPI0027DFDF9A|nr:SLC13 family permease [Neobacillus sp. PS3-40]WML44429.1 SLC13 family permease [Neobacillus sp. PS3-40]